MNVLGLHAVAHDASAALLVDGRTIAAADEERFTRRKHAWGQLPVNAARFCLEQAGLAPGDVQVVAYPWSREPLRSRRWKYFATTCRRRPGRAASLHFKLYRRQKRREALLLRTLEALGIDPGGVEIRYVDHHLAHVASAYCFSGFDRAAVLSIDGVGEVQTTVFAEGREGEIRLLGEVLKPDSLGLFYSAMTEYLGFRANDGEYKLMGMAPYGDPDALDLSDLVRFGDGRYRIDTRYVVCSARRAHRKGVHYARALVDRLGPPREGDAIAAPYTHVAAATQRLFENAATHLVERQLGPALERSGGRLALAGGCALNVVWNGKLLDHPRVREVYVQPNAGDGGTSLGAAAVASAERGRPVEPMRDVQLGPGYGQEACRRALEARGIAYEEPKDVVEAAAELLACGVAVAWFQGRMEWGPRALGNRSVLGNPAIEGQTNDINLRIKFREAWRPFCPSILAEWGPEVFESSHDSPFMTLCFRVKPAWRARIPEVVHVDGTARPHYVAREANPRFRALIERFHSRTGIPCVINTSMNRRGEPMVCSPEDAAGMFEGCGLQALVLGDLLVRKR